MALHSSIALILVLMALICSSLILTLAGQIHPLENDYIVNPPDNLAYENAYFALKQHNLLTGEKVKFRDDGTGPDIIWVRAVKAREAMRDVS